MNLINIIDWEDEGNLEGPGAHKGRNTWDLNPVVPPRRQSGQVTPEGRWYYAAQEGSHTTDSFPAANKLHLE